MNSMLNPADSLKTILHFPSVTGDCFYCNEKIKFYRGVNRYVGATGIHCKGVK